MSHKAEADKLWRQLRRQGFTIERTNGDHVRITHPAMARMVFAPSTPSDYYSLLNVQMRLKRETKKLRLCE